MGAPVEPQKLGSVPGDLWRQPIGRTRILGGPRIVASGQWPLCSQGLDFPSWWLSSTEALSGPWGLPGAHPDAPLLLDFPTICSPARVCSSASVSAGWSCRQVGSASIHLPLTPAPAPTRGWHTAAPQTLAKCIR